MRDISFKTNAEINTPRPTANLEATGNWLLTKISITDTSTPTPFELEFDKPICATVKPGEGVLSGLAEYYSEIWSKPPSRGANAGILTIVPADGGFSKTYTWREIMSGQVIVYPGDQVCLVFPTPTPTPVKYQP